ncbi:hypothetical protein B0181_03010 [Moraxella caviae]|nr:hypothetical protein B0181_03010 [Moraxella caviae]
MKWFFGYQIKQTNYHAGFRHLKLSMIAVAVAGIFLAACHEDFDNTHAAPVQPEPIQSPVKTQSAKGDSLVKHRVNVSADCPRLVQKRVDSTQVSRRDSMIGKTCDYYIYPDVGDVVDVQVSDDRMRPYLEIPYYHDFANGSYKVVANGRHVIRLKYDAIEHKPDTMDYTIRVDIRPAQ